MRFLFHIAYDGSPYFGWQRQPEHISVQQVIEETLERLVKAKVHCQGCGRTDTGVHASQFFFHTDLPYAPGEDFIHIFNLNLPPSISVFGLYPAEARFHAQHSAVSRTYHYFIHTGKDAFFSNRSWWNAMDPDWESIHETLVFLKGMHEMRAFCLTPEKYNHTLCQLYEADITPWGDNRYCFIFKANRFLRGMVRILVANLVELGKDPLKKEAFLHHLVSGEKLRFHNIAPPQGLYLSGVEYPGKAIPRQGWMPGGNEFF